MKKITLNKPNSQPARITIHWSEKGLCTVISTDADGTKTTLGKAYKKDKKKYEELIQLLELLDRIHKPGSRKKRNVLVGKTSRANIGAIRSQIALRTQDFKGKKIQGKSEQNLDAIAISLAKSCLEQFHSQPTTSLIRKSKKRLFRRESAYKSR